MLANLPLPWTLESVWILLQIVVQLTFIAGVIMTFAIFAGAAIKIMLPDYKRAIHQSNGALS